MWTLMIDMTKELLSILEYTQHANNMWLVLGFVQLYTQFKA